ncbi:MAG: hypothetical protein LBT10_02855, partial [Methanobrevibacter sp.]|nr:hypothetical protein [Methanobrevibacter sp.]
EDFKMEYMLFMKNKNKIPLTNILPNKLYKHLDGLEIETKKGIMVLKKRMSIHSILELQEFPDKPLDFIID